jgi:bacillolysin
MKNNFLKIAISITGCFNLINIKAQENMFSKSPDPAIFSSVNKNGWVNFQQTKTLQSATLFIKNKRAFGLSDKYEMKSRKTITDELGIKHSWMQQFYNKIPVLFGEFILHEKNGQLISGNGKIYTAPTILHQFNLTKYLAIEKALQYVKAKKYWWQDSIKENKLKRKTKDQSATYFPKPVLYYYFDDKFYQLRPCYQILIQTFDPGKSGYVYIDAVTGNVFRWNPVEKYSCDAAVVNTPWYANRTIFTYTNTFISGWDMEDDCTPSTYKVYDFSTPFNSIFNSSNNQWLIDRERSAATCLWSIRQTRDVFNGVLGRNGHDGNGGNIDMYFDYIFANNSTYNASYHYDPTGDDEINIGTGATGTNLDDYGALDIMAHEFTHGVIHYTANFIYERESGALDESFADVFGEYVENRIFTNNNWLLGWDRIVNGMNAPVRDLSNPQSFAQPDRYMGFYWKPATNSCIPIAPGEPGDNDYCGVHFNSGVQNRMYYLLSTGGSGWTNDSSSRVTSSSGNNPYSWTITGIGIEKAVRIAYRAISFYLGANANYFDSRNAWVHAAVDLYGACSFEAIQTGKAWHAVGIFPPPTVTSETVCGTVSGAFSGVINGTYYLATNCALTINNGALAYYGAGKVVISPGFRANNGSQFKAYYQTNDCAFAGY